MKSMQNVEIIYQQKTCGELNCLFAFTNTETRYIATF